MTTDIQKRIQEEQRKLIPGRLLKGAGVLGELWRSGIRCPVGGGWMVCGADHTNQFCDAKRRWVELMEKYLGGRLPFGVKGHEPYALLEMMTVSMFEATKLTVRVEGPPGRKPIKVGPKGTHWGTISDLGACEGEEQLEAWDAVLLIQETIK